MEACGIVAENEQPRRQQRPENARIAGPASTASRSVTAGPDTGENGTRVARQRKRIGTPDIVVSVGRHLGVAATLNGDFPLGARALDEVTTTLT